MRWSVYVDFSRPLTADERSRVFEAVERLVPDSGCVGPNAAGLDELYVCVAAPSADEARGEAARYLASVLRTADLDCATELTVHPYPG